MNHETNPAYGRIDDSNDNSGGCKPGFPSILNSLRTPNRRKNDSNDAGDSKESKEEACDERYDESRDAQAICFPFHIEHLPNTFFINGRIKYTLF